MEEIKREISQEEMEKIAGGFMPVCSHPKVSEYLGQHEVRFGELVYLWKCSKCGAEVWCLNPPPKTGGATGTW